MTTRNYPRSNPIIASFQSIRWNRKSKDRMLGVLLVLPAVLILVLFKLFPIISTFVNSLYQTKGFGTPEIFVGIDNYIQLFSDELYIRALRNTTVFFLITTIGCNVFGIALALLLNTRIRGRAFFRMVYFLPVVISSTATSLLWRFLLDNTVGVVNPLLKALHLDFLTRSWFGDPKIAMITISLIAVWQYMGYHMVIYLSGLQTINNELYEVASIDGAGPFAKFAYITLPLLRPFILIDLILCIIGGFSVFDFVFVITKGGPMHRTETLMTYMYHNGFKIFRKGYASAIIVSVIILVAVLGVVHHRISQEVSE